MPSVGTIKYKNGNSLVDILHPIGSFYMSTNSTSPSSLFGGTWIQVTNAALRGANATGYTGSDTCTLTTSQIPSHEHKVTAVIRCDIAKNDSGGNHIPCHYTNWNVSEKHGIGFIEQTGGGGHSHKHTKKLQLFRVVPLSVKNMVGGDVYVVA